MKKVFAALLLVVVTCSLASAAEIGFTGNVGGGHHTGDWHDAGNWFIHPNPAGRLPGAGDNASIDRGWGGASATMSSDVSTHQLKVSHWYTDQNLTIDAGVNVNLTGNFLIGGANNGGGKVVSSGNINVGNSTPGNPAGGQVNIGEYGNGYLEMNGGSLTSTYHNVPGWWANSGSASGQTQAHVQLNGGTITAWDWNLAAHDGTRNGTMDIAGGVLQGTRGDMATRAQTFVDNGWLTAYGGIGTVNIDTSGASGYAVRITGAVPEPTSLVLLSLASLALVVRRRK